LHGSQALQQTSRILLVGFGGGHFTGITKTASRNLVFDELKLSFSLPTPYCKAACGLAVPSAQPI
jgi:hypothetical protein